MIYTIMESLPFHCYPIIVHYFPLLFIVITIKSPLYPTIIPRAVALEGSGTPLFTELGIFVGGQLREQPLNACETLVNGWS